MLDQRNIIMKDKRNYKRHNIKDIKYKIYWMVIKETKDWQYNKYNINIRNNNNITKNPYKINKNNKCNSNFQ